MVRRGVPCRFLSVDVKCALRDPKYQLVRNVILSVDILAAQEEFCSSQHCDWLAPPMEEERESSKRHSPCAGIIQIKFKRSVSDRARLIRSDCPRG